MPGSRNRVVWSEGLFLQPQHFQQADRWTEGQIFGATAGLRAFAHGFRRLRLDTTLIDQGKLGIAEAAGRFADGVPFNIPDEHIAPAPIEYAHGVRPGLVFLSLPHELAGAATIGDGAKHQGMRFSTREIEVNDIVDQAPSGSAPMTVAQPAVRLLAETAPREGYTQLAVARVSEITADGGIKLDTEFVPTCLRIDVSTVISGFLGEISGKLVSLAEEQTGWVAGRRAQGVAEVRDLLLLQLANRYQPMIDHFVTTGAAHPEDIYAFLVGLSGELATFTREERRPITYPPYNHGDLRQCYAPLMSELRRQLGIRSERSAVPVPLLLHRSGARTTELQDMRLFSDATFVLAVGASIPDAQLRNEFPQAATIGPVNEFQDLIDGGLRGVPVRPLPLMPPQLPHHAERIYFEIDRHDAYWQRVPASRGLAILIAGDFPGLEIECWAIRDG